MTKAESQHIRWKKWYQKHRERALEISRTYSKTKAGKESAIRRANKQRESNPLKWKARQSLRNAVYSGRVKNNLVKFVVN